MIMSLMASFSETVRLIILLGLVCFIAFVLPVLLLTGGLRKVGARALSRCFEGLTFHDRLEAGDVALVYHTYRGLLIWGVQTEHRIYAPPTDAEDLLERLMRFNLTWGLLSFGTVAIPFLAIGNYMAQRRSLARQVAALALTPRGSASDPRREP
jgi:hypothetical protein